VVVIVMDLSFVGLQSVHDHLENAEVGFEIFWHRLGMYFLRHNFVEVLDF
jgi:hypothetical protein